MDIAAFLAIILGFGSILVGAKMEHLPMSAITSHTAFLIVMGGTAGAMLLSYPMSDVKRAFGLGMKVCFNNVNMDFRPLIEEITKVATVARKEGVLAIEGMRASIEDESFRKSLRYVIDGFEPGTVTEILETEAFVEMEDLNTAGKAIEAAGGYSPTIGIIGAVLGLIHVMRNLDNPEAIGPGIAVAFVATVYGVGFANLFFMPIGTRIKRKAELIALRQEVVKVGIAGIQEGLNPHFLKEKLEVFLDPSMKTQEEV